MSSSEKVCCHLLPPKTVLLKISLTCRIRDTVSKNSFFTPSLYLRRSLPLDHKGHPLEGGVRKKCLHLQSISRKYTWIAVALTSVNISEGFQRCFLAIYEVRVVEVLEVLSAKEPSVRSPAARQ